MTTIHVPSELKLVSIGEIEPGSLFRIIGREDDIPMAVRLLAEPGAREVPVMILGGPYSFGIGNFDSISAALLVCKASDLRVSLGNGDRRGNWDIPGALSVHEGGASITAMRNSGQFSGARIDVATWAPSKAVASARNFVVHFNWTFGIIDGRGDFVRLFSAGDNDGSGEA